MLQRHPRTLGVAPLHARLKADLAAGRNARLARRKAKSRQRAALHRQGLRKAQAEARVGREEALERRFNVPERARKQDEYPLRLGDLSFG